MGDASMETDNTLEAFGSSIERSEGTRVQFEVKHLESQERMHRNMPEKRKCNRAEHREEEECREKRGMKRMKAFMEFSMKVIVTIVKKARKKKLVKMQTSSTP